MLSCMYMEERENEHIRPFTIDFITVKDQRPFVSSGPIDRNN